MELVTVIESQTRCFRKLGELTERYVLGLNEGRADDLEDFEQRRDSIFKTIELYDRKINELSSDALKLLSQEELVLIRMQLDVALQDQQKAKAEAQRSDDVLMHRLEQQLEALVTDLHQEHRRREILSRFKSSRGFSSGTGVDQSL